MRESLPYGRTEQHARCAVRYRTYEPRSSSFTGHGGGDTHAGERATVTAPKAHHILERFAGRSLSNCHHRLDRIIGGKHGLLCAVWPWIESRAIDGFVRIFRDQRQRHLVAVVDEIRQGKPLMMRKPVSPAWVS